MIIDDGFPKEHFIEIVNEPDFLGRITINKIREKFNSEIDIVQSESRKIFKHVTIIYNKDEYQDALDSSVQLLAKFLRNEK